MNNDNFVYLSFDANADIEELKRPTGFEEIGKFFTETAKTRFVSICEVQKLLGFTKEFVTAAEFVHAVDDLGTIKFQIDLAYFTWGLIFCILLLALHIYISKEELLWELTSEQSFQKGALFLKSGEEAGTYTLL